MLRVSMAWMMLLSLWLTDVACINDMNDAAIPVAHTFRLYQWQEWCCYPCGSLLLRVAMTWMMLLSPGLTHVACINGMNDAAIPVAHWCCVYQWHEWCCYPCGSHILLVSMTWMMLLSLWLTHVACINDMNDAAIHGLTYVACNNDMHDATISGLIHVACINDMNDAAIHGAHSCCFYQWHEWCCYLCGSLMLLVSMTWMMLLSLGLTRVACINDMNDAAIPGAHSCCVYQLLEWCCYPWGSLILLVSMTCMMLLSPGLTHVGCINDMNDAAIPGVHSCCLYQWHEWCCYPRGSHMLLVLMAWMMLLSPELTHVACINDTNDAAIPEGSFLLHYHWQECCYSSYGSLISTEDGRGGQTFFYHPRYAKQHKKADVLPKRWCCELSDNCQLFYHVRPMDKCYGYTPLYIGQCLR